MQGVASSNLSGDTHADVAIFHLVAGCDNVDKSIDGDIARRPLGYPVFRRVIPKHVPQREARRSGAAGVGARSRCGTSQEADGDAPLDMHFEVAAYARRLSRFELWEELGR